MGFVFGGLCPLNRPYFVFVGGDGAVPPFDHQSIRGMVGKSKRLLAVWVQNIFHGLCNAGANFSIFDAIQVAHHFLDFGEVGVAFVLARSGVELQPQALLAALKAKLANFKVPKECKVVSELPRNAMGKVQKNVLRELAGKLG